MKHSSAFINYLGYMVIFWKAKLERDYEKIDYYSKEMRNNMDKMNIDEILEILPILDIFIK